MIQNLYFHIVFKRSKPGNSLIINWVMKTDEFFIFRSFNLIVRRREKEQNRFDTMESVCFPRNKRSKIMQWLPLFKCPYLSKLYQTLRFQTCDAGVFLPSPRCSEVTFLGAATALLISMPKRWHNRRICSLIPGHIISNLQPQAPVAEESLNIGILSDKRNTTGTKHRDRGSKAFRAQQNFIELLRPW